MLPVLCLELPENSPRFVILSYELHHQDGRVSFPLIMVYWAPQTSSMDLSTLYTRYVDYTWILVSDQLYKVLYKTFRSRQMSEKSLISEMKRTLARVRSTSDWVPDVDGAVSIFCPYSDWYDIVLHSPA